MRALSVPEQGRKLGKAYSAQRAAPKGSESVGYGGDARGRGAKGVGTKKVRLDPRHIPIACSAVRSYYLTYQQEVIQKQPKRT
jgi:hypothetical protein